MAENFALASCAQRGGTDCVVKLLFRNGCGAFAVDTQEGIAHKDTKGEADAAALAMAGGGTIKESLCIEPAVQEAPKQGPMVAPKEGLGGVNFKVTDRSGVASQCTYSSEGFEKSFGLPANGTVDVFVPAVRLFQERTGTINV